MDGVLINSEPIHQKTELNALDAFGLQLGPEDLHFLAGTTRNAFARGIADRYDFHPDWQALFNHKDQHFYELMQEVELMPGVLELLQDIHQTGLRLGIATSGQERCLRFVLEKFSLVELFDATVSANDVTESKPDPQVFLLTAQRLQVEAQDCIVVEDSINGVRAGKAADMYTIAITTTFPRYELREADRIISAFDELSGKELKMLSLYPNIN